MDVCYLVRNSRIRPMKKFHPNKRDKICQAYLKGGPNRQPRVDHYSFFSDTSHQRCFQISLFELYAS
ncbi:hypothetical protein AHAS_Ahas18G0178800 [Arachis hypogaea]